MIFDKIENLKNYAGLAPEVFEKITAFLADRPEISRI